MKTNSAIERYDRLMLRDLGSNPVYSWKWSEDLLHVMEAVDDLGNPVRETINTGILDANGHEITLPGKQATRTRRWPGIFQQWVICARIELNAEDGAVHGTGIAAWIPVYDRRSIPVCLPDGVQPNQETTESFIKQVRKMRTRDAEELGKFEDYHRPGTVPMDESERNTPMLSQADKAKFDNMKYAIKSGFTAFGEEPGKKGATSFPKTAREMAAEFAEYRKGLDIPQLLETNPASAERTPSPDSMN